MNGHLADARTETGTGSKNRSSCHAVRASYYKCMSHIAFMHELITRNEHPADIIFLDDAILRLCLVDIFLTKIYVEHTDMSEKWLKVRHHHAEFLATKSEGYVCTDNISLHVVCVVLGHHS